MGIETLHFYFFFFFQFCGHEAHKC